MFSFLRVQLAVEVYGCGMDSCANGGHRFGDNISSRALFLFLCRFIVRVVLQTPGEEP